MGALELERGKIKLLELALTKDLSIHEKNLLKGLESMLNFLPQTKVEVSTLGESELWSTYFNPLFTSIFSKTREDILLRWTNKAAANYSSKRPDAIITTGNICIGYGECKLESASQKAVNIDVIKLLMFTQRTININSIQNVFSFNIHGFKVTFFVTSIENEHVYVMKKLGEIVVPSYIHELSFFINMSTINDLLQITRYFWEVCHTDLDMSQYSWKKEIRYDEYVASVPALLG